MALGQFESAKLYDKGVKCIYAPNGSFVSGVMQEGKARDLNGAVVSDDLYGYGSYENGNVVMFNSNDIFGEDSITDDTVAKLMGTYDSIDFK